MKNFILLAGAGLGLLWLTGCASCMCGTRQEVSITSKPVGAQVVIADRDGVIVARETTPCVVSLKRRSPDHEAGRYTVTVSKDGYQPVTLQLNGMLNRAYLANILNGIGFIIDPITGAMWTLTPEKLDARLVEDLGASGFHFRPNEMFIALREQLPPGALPHLRPLAN